MPGTVELQSFAIVVNGEQRNVQQGTTLARLLEQLDVALDRVAVEHNRQIAAKTAWDRIELSSGDQLEIVQFVGGG